jgi:hypothetical protein
LPLMPSSQIVKIVLFLFGAVADQWFLLFRRGQPRSSKSLDIVMLFFISLF